MVRLSYRSQSTEAVHAAERRQGSLELRLVARAVVRERTDRLLLLGDVVGCTCLSCLRDALLLERGSSPYELGHGTPFRTRWINEAFYHLCSFMALREAYYGRWRHSIHHSYTIHTDIDPEIQVKSPADLIPILLDLVYIPSGLNELKKITLHAVGWLSPTADFVPKSDQVKMIRSSRITWH